MFKRLLSVNTALLAGVFLLVIAFLLILPLLVLDAEERSRLTILLLASLIYAGVANRAADRWGWQRLAPIIQPLNVLIVTLAFAILYNKVNLVWAFYFVIPLSAALVVNAGWAYLDGILTAVGYLVVVALNGEVTENLGQHLMVSSILVTSAIFGGTLAAVVRHQEKTLYEKIAALQSLTTSQNTLLERTERHAAQLATLNEIGRAVSTLRDLESVFQVIYDQIQRVVQLDVFYICLSDERTGKFVFPILYDNGKRYQETKDQLPAESQLAKTIATSMPQLVNRTAEEIEKPASSFRVGDTSRPSASLIYVPLQIKTQVIGALSVQSYQPKAYTNEHLTLVTGIANQATIAIENARLFAETRRRADEFAILYETTSDLTTTQDLASLLQTIVKRAIGLLRGTSGGMYLFNEAQQELEVVVGTHPSTPVGTRLQLGEGMAGRVAQTRQPLIVDDYSTWSGRSDQFDGTPLTAVIEVPMLYRGELIGVLVVEEVGKTSRRFTEDDARLLSLFASQAAGVVHSTRLFASAEQRAVELEAIRQASLSLTSSLNPPDVLQAIVDSTLQLNPDAQDAHIYLYEDSRLNFGASLWSDGHKNAQWSEPRKDGLTYTVAREGKPIVVTDMTNHPLFRGTKQAWKGAIIGLPLQVGNRVVGVMNVAYAKPRTFSDDELRALQLLGDQAAIAIVNAHLHNDIQASEQRYRSLIENIPIGVYRVTPGPQGEFLMVNPAYLKMFGYDSFKQLRQLHVADIYVNPSERKAFSDHLLQQGWVSGVEQHLKRKDGSSIWALVTAQTTYQNGKPVYFDCTAIDITARKMDALARAQTEGTLGQRTRELEALLHVSNSISTQLDVETILDTIAQRACKLLNATEASVFLMETETNLLRPIVALGEYTAERLALTLRPGEGIVGWVAQHRQPIIINHGLQDPRAKHVPGTPQEDESFLVAPLIHGEHLQGVIMLNRIPATGFSSSELDLLVGMAAQASAAIVNARLFEATRRNALEQQIITEIMRALNATLDVHQAFPVVVKGLHALVDCERISLALLDDTREYFTMMVLDQPRAELPQGTRMPVSATAAAADVLAGKEHLTNDLATEIDYPAEKILYEAGFRARVNLPLIVGDRSIGSLNIVSRRAGVFTRTHLPTLQQIANAIAITWENMHLFQTELTRQQELAALYALSRQLADTTHRETIVNLVAQHAVQTIHATFARILLIENNNFVVRAACAIRALDHEQSVGYQVPTADYLFCQYILQQSDPVIVTHDDPRLNPAERVGLFLGLAETICLVPLHTGEHRMGLLVLGEERSVDRESFTPEKLRLAHSIGDQTSSALHRAELFGELEGAYLQTVLALANAVDAKDSDTGTHSQRLAQYAIAVGRQLGLAPRELEDLHYGAILHDIGKIGVPDAILKKPGPLDQSEWERMYQHPATGAQIIAPLPHLAGAAKIVRHHHERYDGKGYPDRLAGNAIPIGARILTVVDAYGAIIDKRVYKEGSTHEHAITELQRCAGTQFDPHIVKVFMQLLEQERHGDSWSA